MNAQSDDYQLSGPDAEATGIYGDHTFLVKAGSLARRQIAPSAPDVARVHEQLLRAGVLQVHGDQFRFAKDHLFDSPSGAAAAVLGRTANGWISWKRPDGRTLSEVERISRDAGSSLLSESQRRQIRERYEQLVAAGKLLADSQLDQAYALFRRRFGPDALSALEGEALLTLMHDHGDHDSLVYWLEFKNDDEFRTITFGSIAGGSALKFRIFKRKETGNWATASEKGNLPQEISVAQAIEIARSHRDQLLRGAELLAALEDDATDEDYAALQDAMDEQAPDVSRLAFGHKYFSLLFPEKLDDYHSEKWQRFQLTKLLQLPPAVKGRYVCAGRFAAAAKETGLRMSHFTHITNSLNGRLHKYWRVSADGDGPGASLWPGMRDNGCVSLGWPLLEDLSWVESKNDSAGKLKAKVAAAYPEEPKAISRTCGDIALFVAGMSEGDVIVAVEGPDVVGLGRVVGDYEFRGDSTQPHQRPVEWVSTERWPLAPGVPESKGKVRDLEKFAEALLEIERRLQLQPASPPPQVVPAPSRRSVRLAGIPGRIQSNLERKGQVILYGPPGTGKTYWSERAVCDLAAYAVWGRSFESLSETERKSVLGDGQKDAGLVRLCCFHPAYGYEDFMEGYRPCTSDGQLAFDLRDGIFKRLCRDAAESPERNFYLVVDEINRGDIPRIFGELLTVLEKDKRGKRIVLPLSQEAFWVPRNVYLVGTMNTADRSISLLDAALRRRFGFVELMPDAEVLKGSSVAGVALQPWLEALNARVRAHVGRDARNLQIGHSYLLQGGNPIKDLPTLKRAVRDDVIPLLEEYCYDDFEALRNILGDHFVDVASARIRDELFEDDQEEGIVPGLLALLADVATTAKLVSTDVEQADDTEGDQDEGEES